MMINRDMQEAARLLLSQGAVPLPAEIPGFAGFFVAEASDATIDAIGAIMIEAISYKIGTRVPQGQ